MLSLLIGINCVTRSQTSDTLCFPVETVQKLLIAGKQKKALDSLLQIARADIRHYEIAVRELQGKDSSNKETIKTDQNIIAAKEDQKKELEKKIDDLNKDIKKYKRKLWWTALAGIVGTVGGIVATVFLIK